MMGSCWGVIVRSEVASYTAMSTGWRPPMVVVVMMVETARVWVCRMGRCGSEQALVNLRHRLVIVIGCQVDSGRGMLITVLQEPFRGDVVMRIRLRGRSRRLESLSQTGKVKLVGVTFTVYLKRECIL